MWSRRQFSKRAFLALFGATVATGCLSPLAAPEPMTVQEYARWCGDLEQSLSQRITTVTTFKELRSMLSDVVDKARSIEPPEELKAYHRQAYVVAYKNMLDAADREVYPDDEAVGVADILTIVMTPGLIIDRARDALPEILRKRLAADGCVPND